MPDLAGRHQRKRRTCPHDLCTRLQPARSQWDGEIVPFAAAARLRHGRAALWRFEGALEQRRC
jgi:hypothetical protein